VIPAHIAGLPVEETLLSFAPVGGVLALAVRDGVRRVAQRVRRVDHPER
jgi:hypothetical protein